MNSPAAAPYVPLDEREAGYTAVELAAETLGRDLCKNLVDILLSQKTPLEEQSPIEQEYRIAWLRDQTRSLVRRALELLTANNHPACSAILAGIHIGDDITAKLVIPANAPGRHDLIDRRKQPVVLVMCNAEEYLRELDQVKALSAQGDLFVMKEAAVSKSLENSEITDSMIIDGLYTFRQIDVRAPIWSRLTDEVRHAARAWYLELDRDPSAPLPVLLSPYEFQKPNDGDETGSASPDSNA
jgi:hypothetical protein